MPSGSPDLALKRRFPGRRPIPSYRLSGPCSGTAAILLIVAIAAVGAVWLVRVLRAFARQGAESAGAARGRNAEIDRRLAGMTETMDRRR